MTGINTSRDQHIRHLHAFVEAQVLYYAQSARVMNDLQCELARWVRLMELLSKKNELDVKIALSALVFEYIVKMPILMKFDSRWCFFSPKSVVCKKVSWKLVKGKTKPFNPSNHKAKNRNSYGMSHTMQANFASFPRRSNDIRSTSISLSEVFRFN